MRQLSRFVVALGMVCGAWAASASGQQPAGTSKPITAMPYSPSLDLTSLDRTADPCADFYKFSCGGWQKNNPIPSDQSGWSVYAKLGDENTQFLWGILQEDAAMKDRTPVQQKIGDYFSACMDTAAIDKRGGAPIAEGLSTIDGLKDRAALTAYLGTLDDHWSGSYFFGAYPGQDPDD